MHVISIRSLREFWERDGCADSEQPLKAWYHKASREDWANFADIKSSCSSADWVGNNRIVFNIAGNKFRLVIRVNFESKTVFVRFVGTHGEYDQVKNIEEI